MFGVVSMLEQSIEEYQGPGIFERGKKYDVKKWEVRMVDTGMIINPQASHTLQHYLATYFNNVLAPSTYHVCETGCGTGFYILTSDSMSRRTLILGLLGAHAYINSEQTIPENADCVCQTPENHDLESAKQLFNDFYDNVLITSEYEVYEELLKSPSTLRDI